MSEIEMFNKISLVKGAILSQVSFLKNESLFLFIKRDVADRSSFCKIIVSGLLCFHDTGLIGNKVDFVDVGLLGFKYLSHARKNDKRPEYYHQIFLKTESGDDKIEIIIACQGIEVVPQ